MYVIIVYDVGQERVTKVCNFLRTKLSWVQNSVFEGEVSKADLRIVKQNLEEILDKEHDSVLIYSIRSNKWLDKEVLGIEKGTTDRIL